MKLKFRIHRLPAKHGEFKANGGANILMIQIWDGQLWFLWDKNTEYDGHVRFKLKQIG